MPKRGMDMMDEPNDLQTFDLLGRQSDQIIQRLAAPRANAEAAPNSKVARASPDIGDEIRDEKQGDDDSASQGALVGQAHRSEPRCVDGESGERRQNDDESDATKHAGESTPVGGVAGQGDAPADHDPTPHGSMRAGLEAVFSAVRSTPPATRREFQGRFGRPSKPDNRRTKSRKLSE